jgi:hypothetical protein
MVFGVFTAVWPKLFSKMNYSHGVWLLWLVLVQPFCPLLGVCGVVSVAVFVADILLISFDFPRISKDFTHWCRLSH